ncbi:phytanoyl-CoA dioxygenase family protein [Allorhizocola rhizosphaerae]|uniref:phytanoyl-CoA dioxygenase family protein n=1 Tax=Allorhizocola rhizosphaerae TaxID=1872709 RepID=UPI000E3E783E|nr:phytanoyl-CoA dioxygenase family protein [Allorhizocola rhizosphaerae]
MVLKDSLAQTFRERGYITVPSLVDADRLRALKRRAAELTAQAGMRERITEPDGQTVRTVFNVHEIEPSWGELVSTGPIAGIARELLSTDIYVMQTQLNPKPAFDTVSWRWHSDYLFWYARDGMKEPRALTATVYLDDVTEANGAILAIPASHTKSIFEVAEEGENLPCGRKDSNSALSKRALRELADVHGLEYLTGPAGSVMYLDAQVLHCSTANQSPYDRSILIIRYNAADNPLPEVDAPRPQWKIRRSA